MFIVCLWRTRVDAHSSDTIFDSCNCFLRSLSYYALIMLYLLLMAYIGPLFTLHYMSVRFVLAVENVFDVAAIHSRSFPSLVTRHREHYSPFSIIDLQSLFFPRPLWFSGAPSEAGEDIDIGRVSATRRRRHCAAEAMKKGEEKSGAQKEPREWRGKWRKKGDHRSARDDR